MHPGFRFRPTDQDLVHYYLRKKAASETLDLDVIREIDVGRLEPWDLKDFCSIGTGPQDEWYFFSHMDQRHPSSAAGARRNSRRTAMGSWRSRGPDKDILLLGTGGSRTRIGLRKTMEYYRRGKMTNWTMHELRLADENAIPAEEEGCWVVCRVFRKKKTGRRDFDQQDMFDPASVDQPVVTGGLPPVRGFLDNILIRFRNVQLTLNVPLLGPFGLKFELALL
ncbi:hypothetical protein EJB05_24129, partial [Eragrostis curvula]